MVEKNEVIVDFNKDFSINLKNEYKNLKNFIKRIFCDDKLDMGNLEAKFEKSYIDFSRNLYYEGHEDESDLCFSICLLIQSIINKSDALRENKDFFQDFFKAFDDLVRIKFNNHDEYQTKYDEFLKYWFNMSCYFAVHVAGPSEHYDSEVLDLLISNLHKGV